MKLHRVEVLWAVEHLGGPSSTGSSLDSREAWGQIGQLTRLFLILFFGGGGVSWQQLHCGDNQWQVSLQGLEGKLGVWGGTRPTPNVTAEVLGRGPVKFLSALAPGLWLKNQGTQAGAGHPRGLCKHGRYRRLGLGGP